MTRTNRLSGMYQRSFDWVSNDLLYSQERIPRFCRRRLLPLLALLLIGVIVDCIVDNAWAKWWLPAVGGILVFLLNLLVAQSRRDIPTETHVDDQVSQRNLRSVPPIEKDAAPEVPIDHTQAIPVVTNPALGAQIRTYDRPGTYLEDGRYSFVDRRTVSRGIFSKTTYNLTQITVEVSDDRFFVDPQLIKKAGFRPIEREKRIIAFKRPAKMMIVRQSWIGLSLVSGVILLYLSPFLVVGMRSVMNYLALPMLIVLIASICQVLWQTFVWRRTFHWATDRRLGKWVIMPLPFKRQLGDVLHVKITDLAEVDQSALGRYLGYGIIQGVTAAGPNENLWLTRGMPFVRNFNQFYELVTAEQISKPVEQL